MRRALDYDLGAKTIDHGWQRRVDWAARPIPSARMQLVPQRRGTGRELRLVNWALAGVGLLTVAAGVWFTLELLALWGW